MSIKQMLLIVSTITVSLEASLPCDPCLLTPKGTINFQPSEAGVLVFSSNNCLALGDATNSVVVYKLNDQCNVVGNGTTIPSISFPAAAGFSPNGSCLIVADVNNQAVNVYQIGPNCEVLNGGLPVHTLKVPNLFSLAVSSTGCIVVTTFAPPAPFVVFTGGINEADCSLTLTLSPVTLASPAFPVFSADGSCVAFAFEALGRVSIYPIINTNCNCVLGALSQTISITPNSVAFGPNNCLAIGTSSGVSIYAPDPARPCSYVLKEVVSNGISIVNVAFSANNCLAVNYSSDTDNGPVVIYSLNSDCTVGNGGAPIQTLAIPVSSNSGYSPRGCLVVKSEGSNPPSTLIYGPILFTPVITSVTVSGCSSTSVSVSGVTSPNVTVTIFVDGMPTTMVDSDVNGNFSAIFGPLSPGTYAITAQAQDMVSGCTSTSAITSVVVPPAAAIDSISTTCLGVNIIGTASTNAPVTLFINGQARATTSTDASGTFLFFVPLTSGTYMFSVTDIATGCASATVTKTIVLPSCTTLTNINIAFGVSCNNR